LASALSQELSSTGFPSRMSRNCSTPVPRQSNSWWNSGSRVIYWQAYPEGGGIPNPVSAVKLDVDGNQVGSFGDAGLRRYLCEGNHTAHVLYPGVDGQMETHTIDFAISRPSLFQVSQSRAGEHREDDCRSGPCSSTVWMDLSPYEPDDIKVRVYPLEKK
jgi:hypothetical protein